jgi:hypothetical protein
MSNARRTDKGSRAANLLAARLSVAALAHGTTFSQTVGVIERQQLDK